MPSRTMATIPSASSAGLLCLLLCLSAAEAQAMLARWQERALASTGKPESPSP